MTTVALYPGVTSKVAVGGKASVVAYGPVLGGIIVNPLSPFDQGISVPEILYVDSVNPAGLSESATTVPLFPGQSYSIGGGQNSVVTVNSVTNNHKFSAVIFQSPTIFPPVPQSGTFPPSGPVTVANTIPSYLYREYADDEDLQAFVSAYNTLAQQYVSWFNNIGLPVYTGPMISGTLLDWVAEGVYGITRPALGSGLNHNIGPFNTYVLNGLPFNTLKRIGVQNVTVTTDDVFKRIMTWSLFRDDGRLFNIRWLKRRIMRFLLGTGGTSPNIDSTYNVSVTFGTGGLVSIRITPGTRITTGGALFNKSNFNSINLEFNETVSILIPPSFSYPNGPVLQEAIRSGALPLPFQFTYDITV